MVGKEHGRIKTRKLKATTSLTAYFSPLWPDTAQVCRSTRNRMILGVETVETVYGITSLTAERADAAWPMDLWRNR